MSHSPGFTGERIVPGECRTKDEYLMYLRHVAAYQMAAGLLDRARTVLEVGSGEGYGARRLADGGLDVTGCEIDRGAVFRASRYYGGRRCRFVLFGGGSLPVGSGSVKGVLSLQVIEHVERDDLFVGELSRVLAPQGVAVLTTPNAALRLRPGRRPWNRYHVREYRADDLAERLRGAFARVHIRGLSGSPKVHRLEMHRLRRIRQIDRLDPLRLRWRIPDGVERRLRGVLRRLAAGGYRPAADLKLWESRFGTADFHVSDDVERALDLIAICRR